MDSSAFSVAAFARNPWVYIRVCLCATAVLAGVLVRIPVPEEPQFGYRTASMFAIPFIALFLPLLSAYWTVRASGDPERKWQKPGWTTDPLRAHGPHHLSHLAGMLLFTAGMGMILALWQILDDGFDFRVTYQVLIAGSVYLTGQTIKFGIAIAQGVFAKRYAPDVYSVTRREVPDRVNRIAALLWIGVLVVPLAFMIGLFAFAIL